MQNFGQQKTPNAPANPPAANPPAKTGWGFGGGGQTAGTSKFGFGGVGAKQTASLQLSDVGAELIDASVQFNQRLNPQKPAAGFGVTQVQQQQYQNTAFYGSKSGFVQQAKTKSVFTADKSNAEIMMEAFKEKQAKLKQSATQVQQPVQPQQQKQHSAQRLSMSNMFGSLELEEVIQAPDAFQLQDFVEIKHGFVGLKPYEGAEILMGKRCIVHLYDVYPQNGEAALIEQCKLLKAEYISYDAGIWIFRFELV